MVHLRWCVPIDVFGLTRSRKRGFVPCLHGSLQGHALDRARDSTRRRVNVRLSARCGFPCMLHQSCTRLSLAASHLSPPAPVFSFVHRCPQRPSASAPHCAALPRSRLRPRVYLRTPPFCAMLPWSRATACAPHTQPPAAPRRPSSTCLRPTSPRRLRVRVRRSQPPARRILFVHAPDAHSSTSWMFHIKERTLCGRFITGASPQSSRLSHRRPRVLGHLPACNPPANAAHQDRRPAGPFCVGQRQNAPRPATIPATARAEPSAGAHSDTQSHAEPQSSGETAHSRSPDAKTATLAQSTSQAQTRPERDNSPPTDPADVPRTRTDPHDPAPDDGDARHGL